MQYTIRNIPKPLDRALRRLAREQGKSLNEVTLTALLRAMGIEDGDRNVRDLADIAGTWREDPATDAALQDQRRIDPELWK